MSRTAAHTALAALMAAAFPFGALAQNAGNIPNMFERNVYQQQRIEQGLRDGSLTVQEAARLERGQASVSQMESRALADGRLTDAERARISAAQNRQSAAIERERNDHQRGNPNSRSAQRMQEDVQRNINEQRRIAQGVQSGQITNREASRLARSEARIFGQEARAGADGRIDRNEQRQIQDTQHHQSQTIHHQRHDGQTRGQWRGQSHGQSHGQASGWHHGDAAHGQGSHHVGQPAQVSNTATGTATNTASAASTSRTHGNNGNHYGQFRQGSGAAAGANSAATSGGAAATSGNAAATSGNAAARAPSSPRTRTNNGNHFGQINRATALAQNNSGRGNRP